MAAIFNSFSGFYLLVFFCFIQLLVLNGPIAAQTSGSGGGGGNSFTAELIHRDSPLSPLYNPSTNKLNRLGNSFRRSFSRASHFKQTLKSSIDGIQSQIFASSGEYIMKLSIGTPPVPFFGIADTGSDLTWTQCKPCTRCFKQNSPYFDPKHSSTYKEVLCQSAFCDDVCTNNDSICGYSIGYGDNSFSVGNLSAETFTFESSTPGQAIPIPDMVFGCGYDNEGTFNETSTGIVGLGGGKTSFVSQLSDLIHGKFSYCLAPLDSSDSNLTTKLIFGDNAVVSGAGVISTPITEKSLDSLYFLKLEGIKVGNKSLTYKMPSKTNLFDTTDQPDQGDILIDSGTTLTILPSELYEKLESELKKVIQGNRISDPLGFLSLCYSNIDITKLPTITVKFTGADLELPPSNTFIQNGDGPVCLAFVPYDGISIFGNLSQMNFLIGYDLVKGVISFKPTDCTNATSGN